MSLATIGLATAALGIYAWTLAEQRAWNQDFQELASLQQQERDLTVAIETLQYELAEQAADPDRGLESAAPSRAIFVEPPAEIASGPMSVEPASDSSSSTLDELVPVTSPLGY
ncbi:hypothetical protein [Rubidibacter lacunae]|uniref:hypothetical protein n=1 Tax=Rubidibacter lacunae TaxID=582514 RepID=UPI0004023644|nr:hypothetical protein [Rubidibacter lacunae]